MSERPWWRPGQDDEQDGPLPAVVILEPDYGPDLPLTSEDEEGMLVWRQTGISPQLLDRLADWQEAFEAGHHYDTGWRSPQLQDEWARQARELEAAIRAELGSRADWSCTSGRSAMVSSGSRPYSHQRWVRRCC